MQVVLAEAAVTPRATDIRVDWRRIVADIRASGRTLPEIEADTGITPKSLWRLQHEFTEPRYLDGRALIVAWATVTGGDEASPPMIRVRDIY